MKKIIVFLFLLFSAITSWSQSILKDNYEIIPHEGGNFIGYKENGKIGFVLNCSDLIIMIKPKFDNIYVEDWDKTRGMILVEIDGKWGAVDSSYNTPLKKQPIIPCIYDSMTPFRNDISKVTKNGRTFYINRYGEEVKNAKK